MSGTKAAVLAEKPAPVRVTPARAPALMRRCACAGPEASCAKCKDENEPKMKMLQRKASNSAPAPSSLPPAVNDVLSSSGRPLDAPTRSLMESRFGHDFGDVRVHTGSAAAESARAVGAHAYTVGNDIVFDHGRYDPDSTGGQRLLAHELTHTIQQRGIQKSAYASVASHSTPGDAYEAEADAVAARVMSGAPAAPVAPRAIAHAPIVARQTPPTGTPEPATNPTAARLAAIGFEEVPLLPDDQTSTKTTRRFRALKSFKVPGTKGPRAPEVWNTRAKGGALESIVDVGGNANETKIAQKQKREVTDDLRSIWLAKVGWDSSSADQNWKSAATTLGFDPAKSTFYPTVANGVACDIDHLIELQIGGNNVPENIQPLDFSANRSSGGTIKNILAGFAKDIRGVFPDLEYVILHFDAAEGEGTADCGPCCKIELAAFDPKNPPKASAELEATTDPYLVSAGGSKATLRVPKKTKEPAEIFTSSLVENKSGATLIPGLLLYTLTRAKKPHGINAHFDTRKGTKLPVDVDETTNVPLSVDNEGAVSFPKGAKPKIPFSLPYLSSGTITKLEMKDNNLSGEGVLKPSIPLLRNLELKIRFSKDELAVISEIPKDKLSKIPFLDITEASLALVLYPEFKPSGTIAFQAGPQKNPLLEGTLNVSAPGGEFTATGDVKAHVPGLKEATGSVTYTKTNGWSGQVKVSSSDIPLTKNVTVVAMLSDKGVVVSGAVTVGLPTGDEVNLSVEQKPGHAPVYKGSTKLKVAKLGDVDLDFVYDGKKLKATGETTFTLFGTKGNITVYYNDGSISGKGKLTFGNPKSRASGELAVTMTPRQKFTGEGKLQYKITDSLVASAGAKLDDNEKLTLSGALEFTKPITLFKKFGDNFTFFTLSIPIPIPGASIGPIGLKAKIEASLGAGYSIGPGEIQNAKVEGTFNPLDENIDPILRLTGRLYVGASATISGSLSGSIALDVLIGEVSGGLTVTPSATLEGFFSADAVAQYKKEEYSLDAQLAFELGLKLALALTAFVKARAGISVFSVETRKDWTLASYKYDTGLKLGLKAPVHVSSNEDFKFPTKDQITFTRPSLDATDLLKKIFGGATAEEKKV